MRAELAGAAAAIVVAFGLGAAARAQAQQTAAWVDLVGRAVSARAPVSWLEGGTGRLGFGDDPERWEGAALGEAQLGADWSAAPHLAFHLHARARAQQGDRGRAMGVVEAWAQLSAMPHEGRDMARLRAGALFLPTSRENVGPLWSSPYTFTLSAVNSWMGEDVRPLGLLAEYEHGAGDPHGFRAGACAFGGNDATGALLAWRGFSMGDRLSTLGETLPLPPLPSLDPGGPFEGQDRDGTTPFRSDLDGRLGWAAYLRYRYGDLARVQATAYDNRGDRELHHGDYAWDTHFEQLGMELHPGIGWTLAGEHLDGRTGMGVPVLRADVTFHATYLLLSWQRDVVRATVRWDRFGTRDHDHLPAGERSDEDGHAWTAALLWQVHPALEVGLEGLDVHATRPALAGPGQRQDGGRSVTLGVRYRIGNAG